MIVTRRTVRDEVHTYFDLPADSQTWDENALLIARQHGIPIAQVHRMLFRDFPHMYEDRPQ